MTAIDYCCQMRRKFLVGIIAEDLRLPSPIDMVDCIVDFGPPVVIRIRFCPFCGKAIDPNEPTRAAVTPKATPEES